MIDHNGCFRIELFGGTTLSELVVVVYNKQMKKGGKKKEQKWGARNSESCYFSRNKHISTTGWLNLLTIPFIKWYHRKRQSFLIRDG